CRSPVAWGSGLTVRRRATGARAVAPTFAELSEGLLRSPPAADNESKPGAGPSPACLSGALQGHLSAAVSRPRLSGEVRSAFLRRSPAGVGRRPPSRPSGWRVTSPSGRRTPDAPGRAV